MSARLMGYVSASNTPTVTLTPPVYGVATGGTSSSITVSGQNYTLLSFTSDSNLVVSSAGLFDVLLVGGGGGSSAPYSGAYATGGAGGGFVLGITTTCTVYLTAATYSVDVGAGGAIGTNGSPSIFLDFNAIGGGFGGTLGANGGAGANGGGGLGGYGAGSSLIPTLGYSGGASGANQAGGGGGGMSSAGGAAGANNGGTGGNGIQISGFTGTSYYAGAGGGGGGNSGGGAAGNGGVAGVTSGASNAGVNYGAGAGGTFGGSGAAGAAGAVLVRFKV